MTYFSIPTTIGLAELAAAQAAGEVVPFTHIDLGDGNGAPVTPDPDHPTLVNKVHRAPISRIARDPDHPTWLLFEAAVPEDEPAQGIGWTVREVSLIGGRVPDQVMAIGSYAPVEKTTLADGQGRALVIRMVVVYANAAAVSLVVSPMAYVTAEYVKQQIAEHEAKADPHAQYLTRAEADQFYDSIGLAADAIAQDAARLSAHVAASDPHPQYINAARAASGWAEQYFYATT